MLLNQAIANQQNLYADIQVQIDELLEKQRQIQAHLQRLGSVESQMESAAALVQEAIASINEVCPDELQQYRELITSMFTNPVGLLNPKTTPSTEIDPDFPGDDDPTPPTSPTPSTDKVDETNSAAVEAVVEVVSEVVTDSNDRDVEQIMEMIARISWQEFKSIASKRGVKVVGRSKTDVTKDFRRMLENADAQTISTIRGAITAAQQKNLPSQQSKAA